MEQEKQKTLQLFDEVKMHVFDNMNNDNVPLLSSIAKATSGYFEYDYHSVEDALCLIHTHFRDKRMERQGIYDTFVRRLAVENVEQLTHNFNRIMQNVRREFPDFNLAQESHNPIFGLDANVSCFLRRCSDEEKEAFIRGEYPRVFHDRTDDDDEDLKNELTEYYNTEFVDTVAAQAMQRKDNPADGILPDKLKAMLNYGVYTGSGYIPLNDFFRCNKNSHSTVGQMVNYFNLFAHSLVLPMYSQSDFVIYRGDGLQVSAQSLKTKGFYSGSLSVSELAAFVKNGGRMIKINIPKGTPFLPLILNRLDEGEISLLPNTVLEKLSEMELQNGHFAEYTVVQNPPKLSDLEEATIFKHAIPHTFEIVLSKIKVANGRRGKKWVRGLAPVEGDASFDEKVRFAVNLINSKYGGDW
jgi:hypothetical protein